MTVQMEKIAPAMQANVIHTYWVMMQELQSVAEDSNDCLLKNLVEGCYRQWNQMTGDNKKARWEK